MLRLSVKNIQKKNYTYYDEIKLHAQNKDTIIDSIFNTIGGICVIVRREGIIFNVICLNCASQLSRLKNYDMKHKSS